MRERKKGILGGKRRGLSREWRLGRWCWVPWDPWGPGHKYHLPGSAPADPGKGAKSTPQKSGAGVAAAETESGCGWRRCSFPGRRAHMEMQSPPGDREERAGSEGMEGRAGARDVTARAQLLRVTTPQSAQPRRQETRGRAGSHTQLGEDGKDDTNAPKSGDHTNTREEHSYHHGVWGGGRTVGTSARGLTRLTSLPGCARRRRGGT